MTMNWGRTAEVATDDWLEWLVQLTERGAGADGSDDTPHTTTLRLALGRIKAAILASGATAHYSLIVSANGVDTEWDLLNFDNLAPALRNRINPESGTEGEFVRVAAGGRTYEISAIPDATRTASGLMTASDKIKIDGVNLSRQMPQGGSSGQALTKIDATDYNAHWTTITQGGGTTNITGAFVSEADQDSAADVIIPEPSAAATWSDWVDLITYTTTAAGRHLVTGQVGGVVESQQGSSAWADIVAVGGGDRINAELRLLYQSADGLGEQSAYIRNLPASNLADTNKVMGLLASQITAVNAATIKIQARWQMQLTGSQGASTNVPPNDRTAARLRFPTADVTIRVTNLGEVAHHNTPPPDHQTYLVFEDTPTGRPTDSELTGSQYKTTNGSLVVSDRPDTTTTTYPILWSEEQLTYVALSNTAPRSDENLLDEWVESRRTLDGDNGYYYTGNDGYERGWNATWTLR